MQLFLQKSKHNSDLHLLLNREGFLLITYEYKSTVLGAPTHFKPIEAIIQQMNGYITVSWAIIRD